MAIGSISEFSQITVGTDTSAPEVPPIITTGDAMNAIRELISAYGGVDAQSLLESLEEHKADDSPHTISLSTGDLPMIKTAIASLFGKVAVKQIDRDILEADKRRQLSYGKTYIKSPYRLVSANGRVFSALFGATVAAKNVVLPDSNLLTKIGSLSLFGKNNVASTTIPLISEEWGPRVVTVFVQGESLVSLGDMFAWVNTSSDHSHGKCTHERMEDGYARVRFFDDGEYPVSLSIVGPCTVLGIRVSQSWSVHDDDVDFSADALFSAPIDQEASASVGFSLIRLGFGGSLDLRFGPVRITEVGAGFKVTTTTSAGDEIRYIGALPLSVVPFSFTFLDNGIAIYVGGEQDQMVYGTYAKPESVSVIGDSYAISTIITSAAAGSLISIL